MAVPTFSVDGQYMKALLAGPKHLQAEDRECEPEDYNTTI